MLNGRGRDQYTYISSLGCSVVDYCLVLKEDFNYFSDFHVHTMNDVAMDLNHQDLSMTDLSWIICYEGRIYNMLAAEERRFNPPPRLDLDKIPSTFFSARRGHVRLLSETLQLNKILQTQLDEVYTKFCNLILAEMEATIPIKRACRSQDKP